MIRTKKGTVIGMLAGLVIIGVRLFVQFVNFQYTSSLLYSLSYTAFTHRLLHPTMQDRIFFWSTTLLYYLAFLIAGYLIVRIGKRKLQMHGLWAGLILVITTNIFVLIVTLFSLSSVMLHNNVSRDIVQKERQNVITSYEKFTPGEVIVIIVSIACTSVGGWLAERKLA